LKIDVSQSAREGEVDGSREKKELGKCIKGMRWGGRKKTWISLAF